MLINHLIGRECPLVGDKPMLKCDKSMLIEFGNKWTLNQLYGFKVFNN